MIEEYALAFVGQSQLGANNFWQWRQSWCINQAAVFVDKSGIKWALTLSEWSFALVGSVKKQQVQITWSNRFLSLRIFK